ncbi:MAG TPA: hypothetical protein VIV58_18840 [Kofleriaceae bacterium]
MSSTAAPGRRARGPTPTLQTIEVDTLRYDCAMARTGGSGHAARIRRSTSAR